MKEFNVLKDECNESSDSGNGNAMKELKEVKESQENENENERVLEADDIESVPSLLDNGSYNDSNIATDSQNKIIFISENMKMNIIKKTNEQEKVNDTQINVNDVNDVNEMEGCIEIILYNNRGNNNTQCDVKLIQMKNLIEEIN